MNHCKYCGLELKPYAIYNTCINPKCYLYAAIIIPYEEKEEDKKNIKKSKGKFQDMINTGKNVFKDIKTEMGKTLQETGETLEKTSKSINSNEPDMFDTSFGRMDAGGL